MPCVLCPNLYKGRMLHRTGQCVTERNSKPIFIEENRKPKQKCMNIIFTKENEIIIIIIKKPLRMYDKLKLRKNKGMKIKQK